MGSGTFRAAGPDRFGGPAGNRSTPCGAQSIYENSNGPILAPFRPQVRHYARLPGVRHYGIHGQRGFHLWHVKEVFSNADGSVQFVEMFDSFSNENFVTGFTLSSNSDGVIKNFVFPGDPDGNSANKHMLIATSGFGLLTGAVTPDFTFDQGGVVGAFFNPNATNITISFNGSGDSMSFTGATLPKNGINSLTDAGASRISPGTNKYQFRR